LPFQLVGFNLFAGCGHSDGDGRVEAWPLLPHVLERQVDGRAAKREA
jgi:hypothetical protein